MPQADGQKIRRPRPSYNCIVCRRRKVRCGKEQPACSNCLRIGEDCRYDVPLPSKSAQQSRDRPMAGQSQSESRKPKASTQISQKSSSKRAVQGSDHAITDRRVFIRGRSEAGDGTEHISSNDSSSTISSSSSQGRSSSVGSRTQASSRKRLRPSHHLEVNGGPLATAQTEPQISKDREPDSCVSMEQLVPNQGNRLSGTSGHLSVRNGGQARYVGQAFWAFLEGAVSRPCPPLLARFCQYAQ